MANTDWAVTDLKVVPRCDRIEMWGSTKIASEHNYYQVEWTEKRDGHFDQHRCFSTSDREAIAARVADLLTRLAWFE